MVVESSRRQQQQQRQTESDKKKKEDSPLSKTFAMFVSTHTNEAAKERKRSGAIKLGLLVVQQTHKQAKNKQASKHGPSSGNSIYSSSSTKKRHLF